MNLLTAPVENEEDGGLTKNKLTAENAEKGGAGQKRKKRLTTEGTEKDIRRLRQGEKQFTAEHAEAEQR